MHHRSLTWIFLLLGACENQSPTAPEIAIEPAAPSTLDELELVFVTDGTDPEGVKLEQAISWLKDGAVQWDLEGQSAVPASETAKGETWEVVVVSSDGLSDPAIVRTGTTVQNSTPSLESVSLSPEEPTADSTLQAEAIFADADEDSVSLSYVWKRTPEGGAEETTAYAESYVPGEATAKNETWTVEVTPFDGEASGETGSATAVISNTPPEVTEVTLAQEAVYTEDDIEAAVTAQDADGDPVTLSYKWTVNGSPKNDTDDTLDHDQFEKGDSVVLTVTPNDGLQDGEPRESDAVIIQNSLPTLTGVSIFSDESDFFETSTLSCSPEGWFDADGDAEEYGYTWTVSGAALNAPGENITGDHFSKNDTVSCTIWPTNGADAGPEWTSNDQVIQNTPPVVTSALLDNLSPTENDVVTVQFTATDVDDGDSLSNDVVWVRGGSVVTGVGASGISGSHFDRGDSFYAAVRVSDGSEFSAQVNSDTATVVNAPPMVTSVALDQTEYRLHDTMTAAVAGTDADGDTNLTATFTWYVNNTAVAGIVSGATTPGNLGAIKGDSIYVDSILEDAYGGASAPLPSSFASVIDTVPVIDSLSFSATDTDPSGAPRSDADLTAEITLGDVDAADTPSATVQWTSSGSTLQTNTVTGLSGGATSVVSSTLFASAHGQIRGDTLTVQVTPTSDGATGNVVSDAATLGNALPVISGLTLTPDPPGTDDTLSLNVSSSSDRDGDTVTLHYAWSVDGAAISAATTSTLEGSQHFDKDQSVMVVTTPNDGLEDGAPQTMSRTVANSPPEGMDIELLPAEPVELQDDVWCHLLQEATDPDGDPIDYTFTWRIDETANGGGWRDFGDAFGDTTYQNEYEEDSVDSDEVYADETLECTITATDSEGLASTLTDSVTPMEDPCGSGAASWNSATGSYVDLDGGTYDGGLDFGEFTVEAWVSPTGTGGTISSKPFLGANDSGVAFWQMGWLVSNGTSYFGAMLTEGSSPFLLSADTDHWPKMNTWHHVALSAQQESNGSFTYRFFVDGRLVDTDNRTNPLAGVNSPIRIGKMSSFLSQWPGKVDEVRISSAAVYTEDFKPAMRLSVESETLALYHLDDGAGNTTVTELSGTGAYGNASATIIGGASWSTESVCDVAGEIEKIAVGNDAGCWLTTGGEIDCWGLNQYPTGAPAQGLVQGHPTAAGYQDLDVAYYHACAVDQSGCIECWGDYLNNYRAGSNNGGGTPGSGSGTNAHPSSCDFEAVAVGEQHSCGLRTDGTAHCWGWDNPAGLISQTPPNMTFSELAAYNYVTCGIQDTSGSLYCWGSSSDFMNANLGSPSYAVSGLKITNSAGCGIKESDGQVVCWGHDIRSWNRTGQFPNSSYDVDPMPAIYGAEGVGISAFAGCAAGGTGQVQCWGHRDYSPPAPGVYQDVAGGLGHFCGLTTYGRVQCWGEDSHGETNPPNH